MAIYERTRLCGCGECRFKPSSAGPCPKENEKSAIWLWARSKNQEEEVEVSDSPDDVVVEERLVVMELSPEKMAKGYIVALDTSEVEEVNGRSV